MVIQICQTIKALFKLPLRQTIGMVANLLKIVGLNWAVPDCTTLCRSQKTLAVQTSHPPHHRCNAHGTPKSVCVA
jgi:hypothetical protein